MVLEEGVIEGRKTFGNTIKYIKMTASSNFGNVFSVLVASAFLPFLPMLPMQLLTINLLYDFSQTSIPWDDMDPEYLTVPRQVAGRRHRPVHGLHRADQLDLRHRDVRRSCGTCSARTTPAHQSLFQSGWFIESAAHADADRAHDPHREGAVHAEPRGVAGADR